MSITDEGLAKIQAMAEEALGAGVKVTAYNARPKATAMTPSDDLDTMTTLEAVERSRDYLTLNDRHVGEIREAMAIAARVKEGCDHLDTDEVGDWGGGHFSGLENATDYYRAG
jgi:hypothetical protein